MAGGASKDADEGITDINVTPLVDIVLVLLIIFMVTAKLIVTQGVALDLPKVKSGNDMQVFFSVVLAANGSTMVNSLPVADDEAVLPKAIEARKQDPELRAVIKADAQVPHGRVLHVLDLMKQAQLTKIAFASQQPPPQAPGGAAPTPAPGGAAPVPAPGPGATPPPKP